MLLAVTHLLGVGHLARAAAIARAFARAGHRTTLVSGGVPAPLVSAAGVDLVQLPPVRIAGTAFTKLLDEHGRAIEAEHLHIRQETLLATLAALRPHVVIAELFPFGRRVLGTEFLALFDAARRQTPQPLIVSSVRDILVASKPGRVEETHRRLRAYCDAVLVHGDPNLVTLGHSWPQADQIADLVHYTGYVDDGAEGDAPEAHADSGERNGIVVSGGGSAAGLPLYGAALRAAAIRPGRRWRIMVGRGVAGEDFAALRCQAPAGVVVERARPDFRALLRASALSVSQAGYNTVVDLLRAGPRSVVVPFEESGETEQRVRADHLARRGLTHVLPQAELSAETLAARVDAALAAPRPATADIDLGGASRTVEIVEEFVRLSTPSRWFGRLPPATWQPLDDALSRAADRGRAVTIWWRDDDATTHTPALERLLALSRRFALPIAIAAIPSSAQPSLRERLDGETSTTILVHGLAHANHAPPEARQAELGPHRGIEALRNDAAAALAQACDKLGPRVLPVLVPPWNRIAPGLVEALPAIGYRGLSTFGVAATFEPAFGLRQVNPQVDPIDWRGSRSLVEPQALVTHIAALIDRHGGAERDDSVGLLTHHLVQDEAVWAFCEALLERLARSIQVRCPLVSDLFCATVPQNRDPARS